MAEVRVEAPAVLRVAGFEAYDLVIDLGLAVTDPKFVLRVAEAGEEGHTFRCPSDLPTDLCESYRRAFREAGLHDLLRSATVEIVKAPAGTVSRDRLDLYLLSLSVAGSLLLKRFESVIRLSEPVGPVARNPLVTSLFRFGGFVETVHLAGLNVWSPVFRLGFSEDVRVILVHPRRGAFHEAARVSTERHRLVELAYKAKLFAMLKDYRRLLMILAELGELNEDEAGYAEGELFELAERIRKRGVAYYVGPDLSTGSLAVMLWGGAEEVSRGVREVVNELRKLGYPDGNVTLARPQNVGALVVYEGREG